MVGGAVQLEGEGEVETEVEEDTAGGSAGVVGDSVQQKEEGEVDTEVEDEAPTEVEEKAPAGGSAGVEDEDNAGSSAAVEGGEDPAGGSAKVVSPEEYVVLNMPGGGPKMGVFSRRYWEDNKLDRLPDGEIPLDNVRRPEQPGYENQHLLPGVPRTR